MPHDVPTLPPEYEPLLLACERPGRYVGGEWNAVVKAPASLRASIALAFPDVYDLGMSYHGFRLLYERVNAHPDFAAERVFTPWPDFAGALRGAGLPLTTLENYRPLSELELIGVTLQNELNYSNVLELLDLGGVPLRAAERGQADPLVVAGGEGAYSPECLADFLDAVLLGDGEEAVFDLLEVAARFRREGLPRAEALRELARMPGVYVPSLYAPRYHDDGRLEALERLDEAAPAMVYRRVFDISRDLGSTRPVLPLIRTVQDRTVVELRRGCVNGCRFCQAGMITRPIRERSVDQICEIVRENLASTGDATVTLLSLSTADYTEILTAVRRIQREFADERVSVSLPSLRISAFDVELADEISSVRKSSFTFAPEAGSERLRAIINKPLDEGRFREIVERVIEVGWRTLKLYFMIGLPDERDEDLDGIVEIASFARAAARKLGVADVQVNVTLSPFAPKSHTPFQWFGQIPAEEMRRRTEYVRRRLPKNVKLREANFESSVLEGALARGDRRLCAVVERAWRAGCRFDAWSEHFRPELWWEAFRAEGLDHRWYAERDRDEDERLPFEHLECGTGKDFLLRQWKQSQRGRTVDECVGGPCPNCLACGPDKKQHVIPNALRPPAAEPPRPREEQRGPREQPPPLQRLRLRYRKGGPLRFVSHLDFSETLQRLLRRAGLPLAHSSGFNPHPRIMLAPPLSLGFEGLGELADILLTRGVDPARTLEALRALPLAGLELLELEQAPLKTESLQSAIGAYDYCIRWRPLGGEAPLLPCERGALEARLGAFEAVEAWPIESRRKGKRRSIDARRFVEAWRVEEAEGGLALTLRIRSEGGATLNPRVFLESLFGSPIDRGLWMLVQRLPLEIPVKVET